MIWNTLISNKADHGWFYELLNLYSNIIFLQTEKQDRGSNPG